MRTALLVLLLLLSPQEHAVSLAERGDLAGAEREFRRLLREDPGDPLLSYNLGTVLLMQERYEEGARHLRRAADEMEGGSAPYNLGNTDLVPAFADSALAGREARLRQAIESYKRALLADPDDGDARWNLELARRLLEERVPPPPVSGGGGGGGAEGPSSSAMRAPTPTPSGRPGEGTGGVPERAEELLRDAQEMELQVQRDRLAKPQPPGPIRP